MDAKQMGIFIAERRKELGLTQALLAEQIHVTDKAISRWERAIVIYSVGSILCGLIAWGIPIWKIAISRQFKIPLMY